MYLCLGVTFVTLTFTCLMMTLCDLDPRRSAGIDVDGRREMIKHMIPCIEKSIKRFIAFAKALPGFKELPIDDQIALIKGQCACAGCKVTS